MAEPIKQPSPSTPPPPPPPPKLSDVVDKDGTFSPDDLFTDPFNKGGGVKR